MIKPDILSKEDIELEATVFLQKYSPESLCKIVRLDLESIAEFDLNLVIDYQRLDKDGNLLGMTIFKESRVPIINENMNIEFIKVNRGTIIFNTWMTDDLKQKSRYKYTLAHEVGHWILHRGKMLDYDGQISLDMLLKQKLSVDENAYVKCLNRNVNPSYINTKLKEDIDWIEWQANYWASAILMPKEIFCETYEKYKKMYVKEKMVENLANDFGVSKVAVENRIKNFNKEYILNQIKI